MIKKERLGQGFCHNRQGLGWRFSYHFSNSLCLSFIMHIGDNLNAEGIFQLLKDLHALSEPGLTPFSVFSQPIVRTPAEYVKAFGGKRAIERILICNNGIAVSVSHLSRPALRTCQFDCAQNPRQHHFIEVSRQIVGSHQRRSNSD